MSVCLGQVVVLNHATTQLEATCALVTLDMHLIKTIVLVMVRFYSLFFHLQCTLFVYMIKLNHVIAQLLHYIITLL